MIIEIFLLSSFFPLVSIVCQDFQCFPTTPGNQNFLLKFKYLEKIFQKSGKMHAKKPFKINSLPAFQDFPPYGGVFPLESSGQPPAGSRGRARMETKNMRTKK